MFHQVKIRVFDELAVLSDETQSKADGTPRSETPVLIERSVN